MLELLPEKDRESNETEMIHFWMTLYTHVQHNNNAQLIAMNYIEYNSK